MPAPANCQLPQPVLRVRSGGCAGDLAGEMGPSTGCGAHTIPHASCNAQHSECMRQAPGQPALAAAMPLATSSASKYYLLLPYFTTVGAIDAVQVIKPSIPISISDPLFAIGPSRCGRNEKLEVAQMDGTTMDVQSSVCLVNILYFVTRTYIGAVETLQLTRSSQFQPSRPRRGARIADALIGFVCMAAGAIALCVCGVASSPIRSSTNSG